MPGRATGLDNFAGISDPAAMTLEELRAVCATLAGTEEDVKWGNDLCFCVGGKMYAVTGLESPNITVKLASAEDSLAWCARDGIDRAAYVGRYNWVTIRPGADLDADEMDALVRGSYALVRAKLPKRVRDGLT